MPVFCSAPHIVWALVFQSVPSDSVDIQPHAPFCYSQEYQCNMAADAANHAFVIDGFGKVRFARCEAQPTLDKR